MNKIIILGRLTKDLELKFTAGKGTAVATGTLAVNRKFKREGEQEADFINIVMWGKTAEYAATYSKGKGGRLEVVGRLQTRSYENKEGNKVYVTEVVAEEVEIIDFAEKGQATQSYNEEITPVDDGEIPF